MIISILFKTFIKPENDGFKNPGPIYRSNQRYELNKENIVGEADSGNEEEVLE